MYVTLDLVEIRDASSFILYLFFIWMFHWYCWSFRDVFVLFLSKCYLCLAFNHLNMLIHTFIHLHVLIHTFKHLHMLIHTFNHLHMLIHSVYSKTHDFFDWLLHFISLYGGNTVVYYGFFNNYWCYAPAFTPGF